MCTIHISEKLQRGLPSASQYCSLMDTALVEISSFISCLSSATSKTEIHFQHINFFMMLLTIIITMVMISKQVFERGEGGSNYIFRHQVGDCTREEVPLLDGITNFKPDDCEVCAATTLLPSGGGCRVVGWAPV